MRVVITNAVALNGGDAAILLGMIQLLRAAFGAGTRFVIFDSQAEVAGRLHPGLEFRELWHSRATRRAGRWFRRPRRAFHLARVRLAARWRRRGWRALSNGLLDTEEQRALEEWCAADVVVSTGGTYLVENYSLKPRLFEFELALALGKPLVLFTQSLGPFRKPENARALGALLRRAAGVLVRDEASRRHLLELSVPGEKIQLAADAAFALDIPPAAEPRTPGPLRVAISVREWAYFQAAERDEGMRRFTDAMGALAQFLIERHGAVVTFLSTCQGVPEYRYDDAKIAGTIAASLPEACRARVTVNGAFHRPEELIALLRGFDMVVATRMHLAILSLVAGTPALPIAYEFKTTELFARLGLGGWVQDIEHLTGASLTAGAEAFVGALPALRKSLPTLVAAERRRATASAEAVRHFLESR